MRIMNSKAGAVEREKAAMGGWVRELSAKKDENRMRDASRRRVQGLCGTVYRFSLEHLLT